MDQTTVQNLVHTLVLCIECGVAREDDCAHDNVDAGYFEID